MSKKDRMLEKAVVYRECLNGELSSADQLATSMYTEYGLMPMLARELGCKVVDLRQQIRTFLIVRCAECLRLSRGEEDMLPLLFDSLRTAAVFDAFFARKGKDRIRPGFLAFDRLKHVEIADARKRILSEIGTFEGELEELVLRHGRIYVESCRKSAKRPERDDIDGLVLLGASCGLDITRVGATEEEFRKWRRDYNHHSAGLCVTYLSGSRLLDLLKDRRRTACALQELASIVDLDNELSQEFDAWHEQVILTPQDVGIDESDMDRIRRIRYELEA